MRAPVTEIDVYDIFLASMLLCLSYSSLKMEYKRDLVSAELKKAWEMEIFVELNILKVAFYESGLNFPPIYSLVPLPPVL